MTDRDEILRENPLDVYLERRGVEVKGGKQATAKCPLHDDGNASFSVNRIDGTWFCHAGCGGGSVIDLVMRWDGVDFKEALKRLGAEDAPAPAPIKRTETKPTPKKEVAVYQYKSATDELLYEVVRFEPKDFRQRHYDADGKTVWGMAGIDRVLYQLPLLLNVNVSHIWIVEGEKDCDTLRAVGIVATCNVGGAGKWMDGYSDTLKGKEIIICGDNDEPGRKHVEKVAASLADKAKSIRIVKVPAPHKDVSDYVATFASKDAAYTGLCGLCENATLLTGGIELPIRSMAELETRYRISIKNAATTSLDLGKWLPTLRRYVRPMVAGELVVILGATGAGKTAILQNLSLHAYPLATLFCEMELPDSLTFERYVQISNKKTGGWVSNIYTAGERVHWESDPRLNRIFVCDKSKMGPDELESLINKAELKMGERPALVIVDYAQLFTGKGSTRYERASDAMERLKMIAKDTNTIVVVGSQITRKKGEESDEIYLHDGKESGSIENSSGLVIGAWRDANDQSLMKVKILKNTKGEPGIIVNCNFDGPTLNITERSREVDTRHDN